MKIWTVDAFAKQPYTGNPAAVVLVEDFPEDEICQKIAAEINLSETAFVKNLNKNHFHIRWFTPKTEVKLCGHATLSAVHILNQEQQLDSNKITLDSLSGPLEASCQSPHYTLNFPLQETGGAFSSPALDSEFKHKVEAVKAYDDLIVELPTEEEVKDYQPNIDQLNKIDCRGIIVTARGQGDYDFVSRFFAPKVGVNEDPVTGSAHCKLAHYWQKKLNQNRFLAFQASSRGGELKIEVHENRVHLTGQAITVLSGEWHLPIA